MLTNFEEITEDLTHWEIYFSEDIKRYLSDCLSGKKPSPVKQKDIVDQLNYRLHAEHGRDATKLKMNTVRLRKYFSYFRMNGLLPIVATSEGCYITTDKEEIQKQIKSLKERARQINRAAEGLEKFLI
jgi:hypothetical protein